MIADNGKQRNRSRKRRPAKCEPKPRWVQAFMIMLLYERATLKTKLSGEPHPPQITISLADLKRFEELKGDNQTLFSYDKVAETVTITAPEAVLPKGPKIIHNEGIVTPNGN